MNAAADRTLTLALREESGRLVAGLARRFGDFDLAEEAVQAAVVEALTAWRRDGPPERPGAWLQVAAQRNALDAVRRSARQREAARTGRSGGRRILQRSRVRHRRPARTALRLLSPRARSGGSVGADPAGRRRPHHPADRPCVPGERGHARERIVRAKRKVVSAGISLAVPEPDQLSVRLADVLAVVYVMFNEGFVSSTGHAQDRDLAGDAVWLATVVATSLPREAEAWGLAALLTIQHARSQARFDTGGSLVLLRDQDRRLWDRAALAHGDELLNRAAALHAPGRYQLQGAIAACHASAPSWAETDWLQIVTLYDLLLRYDASPVVRLNRTVALAQQGGDAVSAALAEADALGAELASYHLFHATRAELLTALGRDAEAAEANQQALALTSNDAERRLLLTRLHRHPLTDGS